VNDFRVDLNCDLGESFSDDASSQDEYVMQYVTSANIACGFHAGNPTVMRSTVRLAAQCGLALGAHPGFFDLVGFGRLDLKVTPAEVEDLVVYQVGALTGIAIAEGVRLSHVKPHGALYNMAAQDKELAEAIARAVHSVDRNLVLVGLSGSKLIEEGHRLGLKVASEVFGDRAYDSSGALVPRSQSQALVTDPEKVIERVIKMVQEKTVIAITGECLNVKADTVCLHVDTPGAISLIESLRFALEAAGVQVSALEFNA
jgi:UPF0271 protein